MICQAGRDMDAVTRFNQAVAAAPQQDGKGRDLSLAFANRLPTTFLGGFKIIVFRSAALLKLGHPNLALEDIAEAVKAGYPQDLTYKVKYCWEKCKVKNVYVMGLGTFTFCDE